MSIISSETLHASTVAIDGRAVVIEGPSGAGKSDLALRLIDRGAALVSDDYTLVVRAGDALLAGPAPNIEGRIEVRGIGIVAMPHVNRVPVALLVRLVEQEVRMPESETRRIAGVMVPVIEVNPFPPSAPLKIEIAFRRQVQS